MKRSPMRRATKPMKRTGRLRARRKGRGGAVSGRQALTTSAWRDLVARLTQDRALGRCEVPTCRKRGALDPHHVVKRSQGGEDTAENIVMLCRNCHDATDLPTDHRNHLSVEGLFSFAVPHQPRGFQFRWPGWPARDVDQILWP